MNPLQTCDCPHCGAPLIACALCGTTFYGRRDARYCSNNCRQKAHQRRKATR